MALYRAFQAFRPEKSKQALIPALPYDVMNSDEAKEMVKDNPYSFLHIDKAEIDLPKGTDIYSDKVYRKAKENLENLEKTDRKSTRLNSSHMSESRMPSSA